MVLPPVAGFRNQVTSDAGQPAESSVHQSSFELQISRVGPTPQPRHEAILLKSLGPPPPFFEMFIARFALDLPARAREAVRP